MPWGSGGGRSWCQRRDQFTESSSPSVPQQHDVAYPEAQRNRTSGGNRIVGIGRGDEQFAQRAVHHER